MMNDKQPRRPRKVDARRQETRWLLAVIAALAVLVAIMLARRGLLGF
jgi:hypothetical protein